MQMQIYISKEEDQMASYKYVNEATIGGGGGLCKWAFLFILLQKIMHLIF